LAAVTAVSSAQAVEASCDLISDGRAVEPHGWSDGRTLGAPFSHTAERKRLDRNASDWQAWPPLGQPDGGSPMQRWEYLWAYETADVISMRFTHPQSESVLSLFPCNRDESSGSLVKIDKASKIHTNWTGSWWLTQLADDGWELVCATAICPVPGLMTGLSHLVHELYFRRPLA
jgi:hypothetical protein